MQNIYLKNPSVSTSITITDLGITIPPGQLSQVSYRDMLSLTDSSVLFSDITAGTVVVNNGTVDLAPTDGVNYISLSVNLSNYYTQAQINTLVAPLASTSFVTTNYYAKTDITGLFATQPYNSFIGIYANFSALPVTAKTGDIALATATNGSNTEGFYRWSGTAWVWQFNNMTAIPAHNALTGLNLADYQHLSLAQYNALTGGTATTLHSHDGQYYTQSLLNAGQLDNRYYTQTSINTNYYNKTSLQTSGQALVHWDNISNKPNLGGNNWLPAVALNYTGSSAPNSMTGYVNGDRAVWMNGAGANNHIYQFNGTAWIDTYTPVKNDTLMVGNDGDGKPAQYWYSGTAFLKTSDPDFASHSNLTNLTADDHLQYLTVGRLAQQTNNPTAVTFTQALAADSAATGITIANLKTLQNASEASSLHNHSSLYYTKTLLDGGQLDGRYSTTTIIASTYYSKTQLQTAGQAQVSWSNITSAPATYAPSAHTHPENELVTDLVANYYNKTNLQTSGQAQVNWANITSTPATFPPAVHNHDTSYYTKAQVDATLAAITYTTISANDINTNVTGAELEILTNGSDAVGLHTHSDLSTQLNAIGLQQAYNIGQTINASKADISIQASAGYAPLALKTITYVPTLSLAGGEICYYDNEMFYYDSSRATWLSMASHSIHGTNSGSNLKNVYLTVGSSTMSANSGWVFPWMGTIMSMEMTSDGVSPTTTMAIYKNGVSVYTLAWNTTMKSYQYNINIEFVAGDVLAFYAVTGSTGPTRPIVNVQIKRRLN